MTTTTDVLKALLVFLLIFTLAVPPVAPLVIAAEEEEGEGEGPSEPDADGDGVSDAAEAEAAAAAEASVKSAAAISGVDVSVNAVDTTKDPNAKGGENVTVNGVSMSVEAALSAIGGMADAQSKGLSPSNDISKPGFNVDATLRSNADEPRGQVVGSMTGEHGTPTDVAKAEIDAAQAQADVVGARALSDAEFDARFGDPTNEKSALFSPTSLTTGDVPVGSKDIDQALSSLLDPTPISYQTDKTSISLPSVAPTKEVSVTTYNYDPESNSFSSDDGKTLSMNYMDAIVNLTQIANPYGTLKNSEINYDSETESFVFTDTTTGVKSNVPVNQFSPVNSMIQARITLNQQIPAITYTPADLDYAARMALAEAGSIANKQGITKEAALQQALEVTRNRVLSRAFPDNLTNVINEVNKKGSNAYEVVKNGSINRQPTSGPAYDKAVAMAKAVFDGVAPAIAVSKKGQGHLNFGNLDVIDNRPSTGPGVTSSEATKAGFSNFGGYDDTLSTFNDRNSDIQHTSGFYNNDRTNAPDFTTGYSVNKPDFTAVVNMGSNFNVPTQSGGSAPSSQSGGSAPSSQPSTGTNEKGREIGTEIGAAIGGVVCGGTCSAIGGWLGGLLGGSTGGGGTPTEPSGEGGDPCHLYPVVPCSGQSATAILAVSNLFKAITTWLTPVDIDQASEVVEEPYVLVVLNINDQTKEIEMIRPDIVTALASGELSYPEIEELRRLLNDTAVLFSDDGSVLYSNGLYSPPVNNGQLTDVDAPRYVYVTRRIDVNGNVIETTNESMPNETVLQKVLRRTVTHSSPFTISNVSDIRYRVIDPAAEIPGDEYYDYVVTLNNGEKRAITVPQYSSIRTMEERFGLIGFQGQPLNLLAMAYQDESEPPRSIIGTLLGWGAQLLNRQEGSENDNHYTDVQDSLPTGQWSANNVEGVFIYPNAAVSCYEDISGYEQGFVYTALVRDEDNLYVITEGLCGDNSTSTLAISTSLRLASQFGIKDVDYQTIADVGYIIPNVVSEEELQPGITKLHLPPATTTPATIEEPPEVEDTPIDNQPLPNLTNTIKFEVKAVDSDGQVLSDWEEAEDMAISSGVQLYFRWDASDYQQCLPFLNDNGNYSLTRQNRAMISGNTEEEQYNVSERTGVYRLECGGQRNNEFGVDYREIEVVVR